MACNHLAHIYFVLNYFQYSISISRSVKDLFNFNPQTDNDGGCYSTQDPTYSWALSRAFAVANNGWCIWLSCFGVCRYWGKSINKYVLEPQPLQGIDNKIFITWTNGLILGGSYFHPASRVLSTKLQPCPLTKNKTLVFSVWPNWPFIMGLHCSMLQGDHQTCINSFTLELFHSIMIVYTDVMFIYNTYAQQNLIIIPSIITW